MQKGKLIHCNGIVQCQEPLQPGYHQENGIDVGSFRNIFFKDFELDYILDFSLEKDIHFHIATHSKATSTCQEKADITGLPLERVIKGVYLEDIKTGKVYAIALPGTKHGKDIRLKLADYLGINQYEVIKENRIRKTSKEMPICIKPGTVHPFLNRESFHPKGIVELILFDANFSKKRKNETGLDDFSFTAHPSTGYDNHRLSIQMNYNDAYEILRTTFVERVQATDLV